MNILQILPELHVGGVERGTVDLARYLAGAGHKAVVVSAGGALVNDLEKAGAIHYQLPVHKKSLLNIIRMVPRLVEIIVKENIDVVHARSRVPAWIAYFACRRTRKPFITTCHGYYRKHLWSFVMGWADRVIAPSNVIARHMIEDFGTPHERIRLIPRSVDTARFLYSPRARRAGEFNVGIIGRITPLKGHLDFIKAMAKVARTDPSLKVWIVGDAPASKDAYKEQLRILVERLGLTRRTQFLGMQRNIPEVLSQLDCLVMASTVHEAFGRVIVEAQACGVPVVATAVGGVIDIIEDKKTGLLVAPHDPAAIAEAVIDISRHADKASAMAEEAHAKVMREYTVELMAKRTLAVYEDALKRRKILVIKFSSLGDVILSSAGLRALRRKFPQPYSLSFLVADESKEIMLRCPYIDELLVCDLKHKDKGISGLLRLAAVLRKKKFDIVIDLQNNRKSHSLCALSLAPDRYGYDNNKFGFLLNHRIKDAKDGVDPVTHQFRIFKMLGIELSEPRLELWPTSQDCRFVDELLKSSWLAAQQKIVGINISASRRWETKVWPASSMLKLFEELSRRDMRIALTGTAEDSGHASALINALPKANLINTCGKLSVNQLACLIRRCSVYISGDSAPLHVAASTATPFVALFGPTDPSRHLPPASRYCLIRKELECSPCYKSKCRTKQCMNAITAEEVLAAVDSLIKPG